MSSAVQSQQVSWWDTHLFITELTKHCDDLPAAGTPAWCALTNDDSRKLLALAVAGEHHVLRVETAQEALAAASRTVSAAADWSAIANEIRRRREVYIPRAVRR